MTLKGSCHCGKIRFAALGRPAEAMSCNCSICRRKGSILHFIAPETFTLETSRDDIFVYTFNKHIVRHQFCKTCGCAPFAEVTQPDGSAMVAINLRCADDVDVGQLKIVEFDGAGLL